MMLHLKIIILAQIRYLQELHQNSNKQINQAIM